MPVDARRRVTPKRVVAVAGVVVLLAGGLAWAVTSSRGPDRSPVRAEPLPAHTPRGAGVDPIAPWWERVPPVAGDLVPIDRFASGHVTIARGDGDRLQVRITDLDASWYGVTGRQEASQVRVVLSAGAVVGQSRGYWAKRGKAYDLGTVAVERTVTIDVPHPDRLPSDVRSIVLLTPGDGSTGGDPWSEDEDGTTPDPPGTPIAGAALFPSD